MLTVGLTMGGAEKLILNMCKALRNDFEFFVAALKGDGPLRTFLETEGIKTFSLGGRSPIDFRIFLKFNGLVKKLSPHIVHSHLFKANWIGRIIAWANRIPEISTIHNISILLNPVEVLLERCTAHLATTNICCSKYVCLDNTKRTRYPYKYYIYNGVETADRALKDSIDPYKVVVVSRIDLKQKALLELIEAISILNKNGQKFSVDIYGEGEDIEVLKERIRKLNLEKMVILKGFTAKPETILTRYSVFILPSKFEGLPISILEAISSGLVVVASNVGGVPEIIEDGKTGFLIDGYSPENIAKTLCRVVDRSNDLPRIAVNARRKLATTFNLEQSIVHWRNLYDFILENNSTEGLSGIIPHV